MTRLDRLRRPEWPSVVPSGLSPPSAENAVYALTAVLLFGGLFLVAAGTVWVASRGLDLPGTTVVGGLSATGYGVVLLVVLSRAGLLGSE